MTVDRTALLALVTAINTTAALSATAKLDYLDADAPAASVQQLPGARWLTRYVNGSGTHEQPFAVLTRTASDDTSGRVDAAAEHYALATALEATSPIDGVGSIVGTDTPSLTERDTNGQETWRSTFVIESEVQGA